MYCRKVQKIVKANNGSDSIWLGEVKKAAASVQELLESFKKYGHSLEVLGKSDELIQIDQAREALKAMLKRTQDLAK